MNNGLGTFFLNLLILASIVSIAMGMYVYNSATTSITSSIGLYSEQEIKAFNAKWETFGGRQSGTYVNFIIDRIVSNAMDYEGSEERLIDLKAEPTSDEIGNPISIISTTKGDHGISEFKSLKEKIEDKHSYFVELNYNSENNAVESIYIHYNSIDE